MIKSSLQCFIRVQYLLPRCLGFWRVAKICEMKPHKIQAYVALLRTDMLFVLKIMLDGSVSIGGRPHVRTFARSAGSS